MKRWQAVWLCYGGLVCVAVGVNVLPVYLTTFSAAFGGLGEEQMGRIPAVLFAGLVTGVLLGGPLADRLGARVFAVGGMGLSAVGFMLLASARSYGGLLAATAVAGLGLGALDMIVSPIVSAIHADRRASALNRLHGFYCLGAVATVMLASGALRLGIPWRAVIAVFALLPGLLMVGFLRVWLPPLVHPEKARQGLRYLLVRPRFYAAMLAIALAGATEAGMVQWLPAYSERVLGYSKATGGMALAAFSLAMMVGRMTASHRPGRLGPHGLVIAAAMLCAGLYLVGVLAPVAPVALAGCVLVGLACSVLWPTNLAMTADRIPQGGATMFALMAGVGNVGCLVVPWCEGVIAEQWNLRVALLAGTCFPVLLAGVVLFIFLADRGEEGLLLGGVRGEG